jgi:TonB family protein
MDRLQKKCFFASAGVHVLLFAIILFCPGFFKAPPTEVFNTIEFIPTKLVDGAQGGGNPNARPPAANTAKPAPPVPATPKSAQVEPPPVPVRELRHTPVESKVVEHELVHEPARPRVDPDAFELHERKPSKKLALNLTPISRSSEAKKLKQIKNTEIASTEDNQARQQADARRRALAMLNGTARSLRDDLSPSTSVEEYGPGGGGPAYADYGQVVKSIYDRAWVAPDDTTNDDAITKVTVTIRSDGSVKIATVVRPSGDAATDNSVRRTLERVTYVAPFPEGSKERERTYTINFNLKAKRALG